LRALPALRLLGRKDASNVVSNVTSVRRKLSENLKKVRDRIAAACARARRDPADVKLIAVTKYVETEVIRQAIEMGLLDIGESRAQQLNQRAGMMHEFIERRNVLVGRQEGGAMRPRWHMVGHLQRNKVKLVVPWAELVHSVDSLRLAEDLHQQAEKVGRVVPILLQVNTSGEKSKYGVAVGAAPHLTEHLASWPGIKLRGLMTMAPLGVPPAEVRLSFDRLRDVFEDMRGDNNVGPEFTELSMGMSSDFEAAIEAGATMVRIGSTLFEGLSNPASAADEEEDADE
jgi:pyridoxal phosphate enzyme (YggS family)